LVPATDFFLLDLFDLIFFYFKATKVSVFFYYYFKATVNDSNFALIINKQLNYLPSAVVAVEVVLENVEIFFFKKNVTKKFKTRQNFEKNGRKLAKTNKTTSPKYVLQQFNCFRVLGLNFCRCSKRSKCSKLIIFKII
jgi:hypothetical protein